jgi:hypothetical protein
MNGLDENDAVAPHSVEPTGVDSAAAATGSHGMAVGPRSVGGVLRDIALFFAAPFMTIASVAMFPFIGLAMLARTSREARRHRKPAS